jgi:hypothetical protein
MEETKPRIRVNTARLDGMTPVEVAAALRHLPGWCFSTRRETCRPPPPGRSR